jgi:hypothetical protein
MVGPVAKREAVAHLRAVMSLSERRACSIVNADRKMIRYRSWRPPDTALQMQLRELANDRKRFGHRRLFILLRQEGEPPGINREEGLAVRKRRARRRAVGGQAPIVVEARPNARWSLEFVHDQFACGRRFRILNIVDDVTRECLAAIPDTSISGRRVARELPALVERRGKPGMIVSDNGTEFTSNANACMGAGEEGRLAFHRAGKAHAERLLQKLQWSHARRTSLREAVLWSRSRPREDQKLDRRLQSAAPRFRWPGIVSTTC